ncbi:MAG: hypothetical protein RLZZ450_807 [Pseudomonadota bacterium]|jgi:lysine N6-hydroxylase
MFAHNLDVAGIGVGPFNLSLAALLAPYDTLRWRFFEKRPSFDWRPGMMLPGTRMQTSFLKDLVTPIDPTNRFSFLSYLVEKGRFYRFVNADFSRVRRNEFADYMRWAASQIDNLSFGSAVESVDVDERGFLLSFEHREPVRAKHLVAATGVMPFVPTWSERHLSETCFHSEGYLESKVSLEGKRVTIIGGGQSGAEIFLHTLSGARGRPTQLHWLSRRANLDPLDETAFVNEYFTPEYVRYFYTLPEARRHAIVEAQKLTGDGVSPETLRELSQTLYENDFLVDHERHDYRIMTHRDVRTMHHDGGVYRMEMRNGSSQRDELVTSDVVILATGYRFAVPSCMRSIAPMMARDSQGQLRLREDYTAHWSGPSGHRLYVMNGGRSSHGIADAQLSLAAWRSAIVVNSLLERQVYRTDAAPTPLEWTSEGIPAREPYAHAAGALRELS